MKLILQNRLLIYALSVLVLVTACEKIEVPGPEKDDPVFEVSFQDGSSNINLGGTSTELISTVSWDDMNIRVFEGSLVNTKNQSSLTFRMRDNRISKPNIANDTLALFRPGEFSFVNKSQSLGEQKVLLNQLDNMNFQDIASWIDAFIPTAERGAFFNISNFKPDEYVSLCLTLEDEATSCNTVYCKNIIYNEGDIPLKGFSLNNNTLSPIIDPSLTGNILFRWNDEEKESHVVTKKGKLEFLAIYDRNNDGRNQTIHSVDMYVDVDNDGNVIAPCFSGFESKLVVVERSPDFSKVEVVWVNEAGKEFTSANISQSDIAEFNITEISSFPIRNQEGHRVKKIDVNFSCTLQAEDGERVVINNGEGSIGFSYY